MATKTSKYELQKKEDNDFYNIEDLNANWDKVENALTEFDDSGTAEGITSFTDMLAKLVTGNKLAVTLRNLKAGLRFVLHTASIVNNCVTDNAKLPLSAAQGKALQDAITKLNGDTTAINNTVTSQRLVRNLSEINDNAGFQVRTTDNTYNVNYLLSNGIYATPKTSLNMPFEGYWILLVFNASKKESNHSGAWIFQIAISTDSNNKALYFRRNINYKESGWETWRTISAT